MCHSIKGIGEFVGHKNYLVGIKVICPIKGKLYSSYAMTTKPYRITKHKLGYTVSHDVVPQMINFMVSVRTYKTYDPQVKGIYSDIYEKVRYYNAGIHIQSFLLEHNYASVWSAVNSDILILVLFELEDIVFYDGANVSVSKFIFPSPVTLKSILKNKALGDFSLIVDSIHYSVKEPEVFLKRYSKIFNSLKTTKEK